MKIKNSGLCCFFVLCFSLFFQNSTWAQNGTLSGVVTDKKTGETLVGASIFSSTTNKGTTTNNYGFYSLTLPAGTYEITIVFLGYKQVVQSVDFSQDQTINIELEEETTQLNEVVVVGSKKELDLMNKISSITISPDVLRSAPAILGEADVMKILQTLPGVKQSKEGSSGLNVRGGTPDQNLILLDGVPIYNANHLFGFFSVFNPSSIKHVEIIKGGFPARYGGRLSSVLDIVTKEGSMKNYHGEAQLGIVSSKLLVEGPIVKEKASFAISGRRSFLDLFSFLGLPKVYMYDVNAKLNWKISAKDRLFLSSYLGQDQLMVGDSPNRGGNGTYELGWGNLITSLRWTHVFSNKLFFNFQGITSNYELKNDRSSIGNEFFYSSSVFDQGLKTNLTYHSSWGQTFDIGGSYTYHNFLPTRSKSISYKDNQPITSAYGERTYANEATLYFQDKLSWGDFGANLGVHYSMFNVDNHTYHSIEPRLQAKYRFAKSFTFKVAYSHMRQYIHLLSNTGSGFPTDLWIPTTPLVKPEFSSQLAIGLSKRLAHGIIVTVEVYTKEYENLVEFKEGVSLVDVSKGWQERVTFGKGTGQGVELLLTKSSGRTTGTFSYTLSKADRTFEELNNGKTFPFKYDRRHEIMITVSHKLPKQWDISALWTFATGNNATVPIGRIPGNPLHATYEQAVVYSSRNGYQTAPLHRLDIGAKKTWKYKKLTGELAFGAYNAYFQKNPYFISVKENPSTSAFQLAQHSLLPVIPYISYTIKL